MLRIIILGVVLKIVLDTKVEKDASILEKEWLLETLITLIAIMTIMYVVKCIFIYGFNGSSIGYFGFLLSTFVAF